MARLNGAAATGGNASPFTVKTTDATPSDALACASRVIDVFSTTLVSALGVTMPKRPVANVNVNGVVSGSPVVVVRALPATSVIPPVSSTAITVSGGSGADGAKRTRVLLLTMLRIP